MEDHTEYEAACEKIRQQNEKLLNKFADWLRKHKLATGTINKHVANIDFYINQYLLYEDAVEAHDGAGRVSMFLGYWFIKKAMWASATSIKSNAASLKKFYAFLREQSLVKAEGLDDLKETIKDEMPEWLATLERYDDPSITDMEKVWGL